MFKAQVINMGNLVKIEYSSEPLNVSILVNGVKMNTDRIDEIKIEEWIYPFKNKNTVWYGLEKEIQKSTNNNEPITIEFDGDMASRELLKKMLPKIKVKVGGASNIINILYDDKNFTTKIIINGTIFDTSAIQNRAIEEWLEPIKIAGINWNGVFNEIEAQIDSKEYTINYIGSAESMIKMIENAPDGVSIKSKAKVDKKSAAPSGNSLTGNIASIGNKITSGVTTAINGAKVSSQKDKTQDNIPLNSNNFFINNIQKICAIMCYIFYLFPFAKAVFAAENDYASASDSFTVNGFTAIFGGSGTFIGITILLGPAIIIALDYIAQLKPYKKIISTIGPLVCIFFEIITFIALKGTMKSGAKIGGDMIEETEVTTKVGIQYGFILVLIMYIVMGIAGYISYYGLKLPRKKVEA